MSMTEEVLSAGVKEESASPSSIWSTYFADTVTVFDFGTVAVMVTVPLFNPTTFTARLSIFLTVAIVSSEVSNVVWKSYPISLMVR